MEMHINGHSVKLIPSRGFILTIVDGAQWAMSRDWQLAIAHAIAVIEAL